MHSDHISSHFNAWNTLVTTWVCHLVVTTKKKECQILCEVPCDSDLLVRAVAKPDIEGCVHICYAEVYLHL